jgi:hypothetical protein
MHIGRCKLMYCPIHGPIVRCQQTKGLRFECHGTTLFDRCNGDGGTVGKHARVAAAVTQETHAFLLSCAPQRLGLNGTIYFVDSTPRMVIPERHTNKSFLGRFEKAILLTVPLENYIFWLVQFAACFTARHCNTVSFGVSRANLNLNKDPIESCELIFQTSGPNAQTSS